MKGPTFFVGDRVARLTNIDDPNSKVKFGNVVSIEYGGIPLPHNYDDLIIVRWDDQDKDDVLTGYIPHGLDRVL